MCDVWKDTVGIVETAPLDAIAISVNYTSGYKDLV